MGRITLKNTGTIPRSLLKQCSDALSYPLMLLFNMSLNQCVFPDSWKFSYMFPVYKKGNKCDAANYRGITSLSACSKVFEIIMQDELFAASRNWISPDQHGFYPKRSVETNLIQFISACVKTMDRGAQMDVVYTDLKAAFDRVDHNILLSRLEKLGVSSALSSWFRSYLTGRTLQLKIGSTVSEPFTNVSGVPQGSNLGHLLFSLYVNELSFVLPPGYRILFADDVKLYKAVQTLDDCHELQRCVDTFDAWCARNFLTISIGKCCVISFTRKRKPITFTYNISGHTLERVCIVRDLGVNLDSKLTFRDHYNDIITRGNRMLGFVCIIAKNFRDPLCLKSLYCSLVRSVLEFSSIVWSPFRGRWATASRPSNVDSFVTL